MIIFNKAPYLERSINSILLQDYKDFELICVDGGSSDGGVDYLHAIKDQRVIVVHQKNHGISAAKNMGVKLARSEFIGFLDADDKWDKEYLSEIMALIKTYPEADGYVTAYRCIAGQSLRTVNIPGKKPNTSGILTNYFKKRLVNWGVHTSSVVLKKNALIKVGLFPIFLSSKQSRCSWLIDDNGNIIQAFDNIVFTKGFKKIEVNDIYLPLEFRDIVDLEIEVPGPGAEDQYVHDLIALRGNYAFKNRVLSSWYGDVPNQDTKKKHSPIFPHVIGLYKAKNNLEDLINDKYINIYLRYISIPVAYELMCVSHYKSKLIKMHYLNSIWMIDNLLLLRIKIFYQKWNFRLNKIIKKISHEIF